ncbi:MAG: TIGR04283 family arsenosugar biosynthesis glycosyltransferase [Deltaproteobacteria bacterium]|nr:TIGR04283 family arsenosugar biosynthesis glycosyltransferase [Deltaproteobacteria bacterium]
MISIVIPTYNESRDIGITLTKLYETISPDDEVIVVDGYSEDDTKEIVISFHPVKLFTSKKGRAIQMNLGAKKARNEYILFLHADTLVDAICMSKLKNEITSNGVEWGWFSIKLNSPRLAFRIIETGANLRASLTRTPLGDHGIFVRKDIFDRVGGFPEIDLMEDIEFVKKIKLISKKGIKIKAPVYTSVRRFEKSGILKTFFTMWLLRILYYLGVSSEKLAKYYRNIR